MTHTNGTHLYRVSGLARSGSARGASSDAAVLPDCAGKRCRECV